jgi:hypothetical protein
MLATEGLPWVALTASGPNNGMLRTGPGRRVEGHATKHGEPSPAALSCQTGSVVGTAREGMGGVGDGFQRPLRSRFQARPSVSEVSTVRRRPRRKAAT